MNIRFALPAARLARWLACGLAILVLLHLIGAFCHLVLHRKAEAWVTLFDMDLEANVPAFYNCFLFFLCSALFFAYNKLPGGTHKYGWRVMGGTFVFLGVDEGSQIHEKFMLITLRLLHHGDQSAGNLGWFYYAWVIPYGIAAALLVLILTRWLLALDPKLRTGLIISGVVYILGAVVMEMYSGKVSLAVDPSTIPAERLAAIPCEAYPVNCCPAYASLKYITVYTIEETLEMTGLIMCAYVLLKGLGRQRATIEIATAPLS